MSHSGRNRRRRRWMVGLFAALLWTGGAPLVAQEPARPDTAPAPRDTVPAVADTVPVRQDTAVIAVPPEAVPRDTFPSQVSPPPEDSVEPAPNMPRLTRAPAPGFSVGRWEWDREELQRWHGISLLELLDRVPGLLVTRGGWYGRPAGIAAFGAGGGRLRVLVDGFELDALASATFDVQHLAVVDLEAVRVERTLTETRIELFTFRQPDRRAFSQIEAGTAVFRTRLLRGLFATPIGERSTITLGLDLADSDGWFGQQPYSTNTVLARWLFAPTQRTGLQVDYRQSNLERGGAPFMLDAVRRDLVLRARALPAPSLAIDGYFGRSSWTPGAADSLQLDLESLQGGLRARFDPGPAWFGAGARLRNSGRVGYAAPGLELSGTAGLRPAPWFLADAELRSASVDGVSGTEMEGRVRVGPFAGLSVFGGFARGARGIGLSEDSIAFTEVPDPENPEGPPLVVADTIYVFPVVRSELDGFRAGVEWTGWGIRLGGAFVSHQVDSIAPFGLAFDRTLRPVEGGTITGWEGYWSVPLIYRPLRAEGTYTRWEESTLRPYLPLDQARIGLSFTERFYDGNLEPTLRVEAVHRGASLVPTADRAAFETVAPAYTIYRLFLQIRVLDVRAFLIWDNLLNDQVAADLVGPGRVLGGQRAIYGVRWHFFD
jgi:hypothetical protein